MIKNPFPVSKIAFRVILLINVFCLAGCSILFPAAPYDPTLFTLSSPNLNNRLNPAGPSILVLPTQPAATLNTNKMAYNISSNEIAYFAKNTWAANPSDMLTPLIMQALGNSHLFSALAMAPFVGQTDYRLFTQLQVLQQNFLTQPSRIEMVLTAQLVSNNQEKLIASRRFSVIQPCESNNPAGGAAAANIATQKILQQLVQFCGAYLK